jgi:hypothetical protein
MLAGVPPLGGFGTRYSGAIRAFDRLPGEGSQRRSPTVRGCGASRGIGFRRASSDSPFAHHMSRDPAWIYGLRCDFLLSGRDEASSCSPAAKSQCCPERPGRTGGKRPSCTCRSTDVCGTRWGRVELLDWTAKRSEGGAVAFVDLRSLADGGLRLDNGMLVELAPASTVSTLRHRRPPRGGRQCIRQRREK